MTVEVAYNIRQASGSDLDILRNIENRANIRFENTSLLDHVADPTMCAERLAELVSLNQVWVVCMSSTDCAVGFAVASELGALCLLEEIDVEPEHGGRGLGKRLIRTIEDWGRQRGHKKLALSTFRDIPWNAPFYRRLGFEIVPEDCFTENMLQLRFNEHAAGLPIEQRVIMMNSLED
jgi:GNAT superfamily N-acetyltransferase